MIPAALLLILLVALIITGVVAQWYLNERVRDELSLHTKALAEAEYRLTNIERAIRPVPQSATPPKSTP